MPRKTERPDIEFTAAVKAKKLRSTLGATYRDVEFRWYGQANVEARWASEEVRKALGRDAS
jgi:hypothetical protein